MSDYLRLIDRFDKLKQTGPDRWIACCPAHDDKSPSLHIKDAGDKLLVRCFAECSFRDIADAIGARPSEFFAGGYDRRDFDKKPRVPWRDVVEVIRGEMWVLVTLSNALRNGRPLTDADHKRLVQAGSRIENAWRVAHG